MPENTKHPKKRKRKTTPLEDAGAVPIGSSVWELLSQMRRLALLAGDPDRYQSTIIEGVELFGPIFLLYVKLATEFASTLEYTRRDFIAHNFYPPLENAHSAVVGMGVRQDPSKMVARLAPPVFPKHPRHVYLVQTAEGLCKIGITQDLEGRLNNLKTGNPYELNLLHSIYHDDADEIEKGLHTRFADKRVSREWFRLGPDDIAYIKTLGATDKTKRE